MKSQKLILDSIPRVDKISREDFIANYVKHQKPVVVTHFVEDWNATKVWKLDYLKKIAGDKIVPLFDNRKLVGTSSKLNQPQIHKLLSEYIDLLQNGPTPYRIFLYNLLKEVPLLQKDFSFPEKVGLRFLKGFPMLFFGGEGSKVFMHYDIDYANILHFHFNGEKRCLLYPPSETKYLYKLPNALISHPEIDFSNPDFEKFPALAKAKGMVVELKHGDMLYIPEGYWHQMTYVTPGFSLSLRALPKSMFKIAKAVYNLLVMRYFDNLMREVKGEKWIAYKNELAIKRTNSRYAS